MVFYNLFRNLANVDRLSYRPASCAVTPPARVSSATRRGISDRQDDRLFVRAPDADVSGTDARDGASTRLDAPPGRAIGVR